MAEVMRKWRRIIHMLGVEILDDIVVSKMKEWVLERGR